MKPSPIIRWPVVTEYDQEHLARLALPLGGIGTGTISLGGRGDLRDWEIVNRPAKGFCLPGSGGGGPFFALYARQQGGAAIGRALEGPIPEEKYEGAAGAVAPNHGLPRFRHCRFAAAYPLGQVWLSDPAVPLTVRLEAFNPLVPGDAEASGLPVVVLRYVLTNRTARPVTASVCGMIPNFIGTDGLVTGPLKGNRNEFRRGRGLHGVYLYSTGLDRQRDVWGSVALAVLGERDGAVSYRTAWAEKGWGESFLDFWEDFTADGRLEEREQGKSTQPEATLAARVSVPARGRRAVTFIITWHFPNRSVWFPPAPGVEPACGGGAGSECCRPAANPIVGNYYATQYRDAWDVAERVAPRLGQLEADTVRFVGAFAGSDLPHVIKDAALATLTALRSQTTFRTADGVPFGWEGCNDHSGCCHGSCTHVWNYENAVGFLFGDLSRRMRRVEFEHATDERGLMSFRVELPLANARQWGKAAADGQMGAIMRCYRDWKLSGDNDFLRSVWPKVRQALEFCWIEGGWDADRDGVMEGCQHNSMDVEYYGPNPQMGLWYLGALRAAEEMARRMGAPEFADTCRALFERGRDWIEQHLFNGEYYEHQIRPPQGPVAEGLRVGMGASRLEEPEFQLGAGCLVDQLVGQYMAHAIGLGYLIAPGHARAALRSVMKYNFRQGFHGHFNPTRSYALGDESGLLMATYPRGRRPKSAFPYYAEVMTGFEYAAAAGMLYEGLTAEALRCLRAIRARYDGRKRSPFDEAECGHHYARAMASWTAGLAWTGFQYSGVDQSMAFAPKPGTWFWSNGAAWGTCRLRKARSGMTVELAVGHGTLALKRFAITGMGEQALRRTIQGGGRLRFNVSKRRKTGHQ